MSLKEISALMLAVMDDIAATETALLAAEETVKDLKARHAYLTQHAMVDLITHDHLNDGARLPDGSVITFERDIRASVRSDQKPIAYAYLHACGRSDLLKTTLRIDFPRAQGPLADALARVASDLPGVTVEQTETLAGPTMLKWVRERLAAGEAIPPAFGFFSPVRVVR